MDIHSIVNQICDQADDFLAGVRKRDEARAGIAEWLTMNYPKLAPEERKRALAQSLAVLDEEGFFDAVGGDSGDEAGDFSAAEEE